MKLSGRIYQNYEEYYEKIDVIGIGGYGCVYKGRDKETKELRAIKVISIEKIKENLRFQYEIKEIKKQLDLCIKGFIEEFNIMKICSNNNNNSIKCYEYFNNENNFAIIMELCDLNLSQLLSKRLDKEEKGFNYEEIYEIMNQLNNTFKIMKKNKIIHRDLKLENILIKYNDKEHKKYTIKLCDYGCSKRLISLSRYCNSYTGTLVYMAPEILKINKLKELKENNEYNYKCDLWSIGIIIYSLLLGKSPFPGVNEIALINNIDKYGNSLIKIENKELEDLIKKLLEKEPSKRIDWKDYFEHKFFKPKFKNIKLIYYLDKEGEVYDRKGIFVIDGKDGIYNIFGEKFVENNKKRIDLMINGIKHKLINKYKLKKGENIIEIIIKNKIINLEYMFYECSKLKNIEELKYLNTNEVNNFSFMFSGCSLLSNIKSLENWNVSNGKNFSDMFCGCESLSDIKSLENWNVSNGKDFSFMFCGCESLSDIKSLENWNVSNGNIFSGMFYRCSSLLHLKSLENWNVSNGKDFSYMFEGCSSLLHLKSLENWNISGGGRFCQMFNGCSSLSDIKSLENWNVSNGYDFSYMFSNCSLLSDIKSLENWNVSNGKNFSNMFSDCSLLSDIKSLENWNVSNGKDFSFMFFGCNSLSDIKSLENWNVSNGEKFPFMFYGCSLLSDIKSLENWNVSNGKDFCCMFEECSSLLDIKSLEKWGKINNNFKLKLLFDEI